MSIIGPGSLGAINLAGSVAGAQRNAAAESGQLRETAGQRQSQADLKALASKSLDDVGETDQSTDRDADGRMPFDDGGYPHDIAKTTDDSHEAKQRSVGHLAPDADGTRGGLLDLEA